MDQGSFTDVAKKALEFRNTYYKLLDSPDRSKVLNLYAPGIANLCEWNGHRLDSPAAVQEYVNSLPATHHQIDAVDAQPLPGNDKADSFIMTIHGVVTYDDEHKREFYQRMVIRRIDNLFYIVNDYYRWLSEI
ncbi:hypothetical protein STCU_03002 [Strigomonas culicis]|uniref:NTF2-related export protein n=1 Tax=Strigomonas culicis TaxID=28005 RepID=S9UHB9_9TRYP|nr:hypothetical protein STCU_05181 [Strigomonas culicis]EPY32049.1 hypothetical protein STCU_03002 [Strigomonas culicis]|eukprot:EPY28338.1 hypothetical protein STCU_05181 [Strigomonas culicis]